MLPRRDRPISAARSAKLEARLRGAGARRVQTDFEIDVPAEADMTGYVPPLDSEPVAGPSRVDRLESRVRGAGQRRVEDSLSIDISYDEETTLNRTNVLPDRTLGSIVEEDADSPLRHNVVSALHTDQNAQSPAEETHIDFSEADPPHIDAEAVLEADTTHIEPAEAVRLESDTTHDPADTTHDTPPPNTSVLLPDDYANYDDGYAEDFDDYQPYDEGWQDNYEERVGSPDEPDRNESDVAETSARSTYSGKSLSGYAGKRLPETSGKSLPSYSGKRLPGSGTQLADYTYSRSSESIDTGRADDSAEPEPAPKRRRRDSVAEDDHGEPIVVEMHKLPTVVGGTTRITAIDICTQAVLEVIENARAKATDAAVRQALADYEDTVSTRLYQLVDLVDLVKSLATSVQRTETSRNSLRAQLLELRQARSAIHVDIEKAEASRQHAELEQRGRSEVDGLVSRLKEPASEGGTLSANLEADLDFLEPLISEWGVHERIGQLTEALKDMDKKLGGG